MDWLIILFLLISAAMGLIQKAAKEAGRARRPPSPAPGLPPPPWLPPQTPAEGEAEEGVSLEEGAGTAFEEGAASEEGVSMEGDFGEAEPAITPEVLHEREELERERLESYAEAEAARLASVEGEEGLPSPSADEIELPWQEEGDGASTRRIEGGVWLWTGEDLVRAVLAAEILGPPGGRWRLVASPGSGQEVDGA